MINPTAPPTAPPAASPTIPPTELPPGHDAVSPHQPVRPSWRCSACLDDWPCPRRRAELTTEFAGHRVSLALQMSQYLADAVADHPDAVESVLYLRFLGWFRDRG